MLHKRPAFVVAIDASSGRLRADSPLASGSTRSARSVLCPARQPRAEGRQEAAGIERGHFGLMVVGHAAAQAPVREVGDDDGSCLHKLFLRLTSALIAPRSSRASPADLRASTRALRPRPPPRTRRPTDRSLARRDQMSVESAFEPPSVPQTAHRETASMHADILWVAIYTRDDNVPHMTSRGACSTPIGRPPPAPGTGSSAKLSTRAAGPRRATSSRSPRSPNVAASGARRSTARSTAASCVLEALLAPAHPTSRTSTPGSRRSAIEAIAFRAGRTEPRQLRVSRIRTACAHSSIAQAQDPTMSIHAGDSPSGSVVWEVRWRDAGGSQQLSRNFDRKRDAEAFERISADGGSSGPSSTATPAARRSPTSHRSGGGSTPQARLAPKTQLVYADLWDRHVLPRLGGLQLRRITPEIVERFQAELRAAGAGDPTIIKVLALLQSILKRAVIWRRIPSNPVAVITKPPQRRTRAGHAAVARTRSSDARSTSRRRPARRRDARSRSSPMPASAPARRSRSVGATCAQRTLLVERAVSLGEVKETKTRRSRSVRLLAPLARDLADWRRARRTRPAAISCSRAADGAAWSDHDYRNWRKRVFRPDREAPPASILSRPYDLRHAFVSLLLAEGRTVVDVAAQAGHAPSMTLDTYGHVIDELDAAERRSAEERHLRGPRSWCAHMCAIAERTAEAATPPQKRKPRAFAGAFSRSPLADSNRRPPPYHGGALPTELRGQVRGQLFTRPLWEHNRFGRSRKRPPPGTSQRGDRAGGGSGSGWIRTNVGEANGFTARPL